ncbi:MAG: protein kinase [Planctomycetia bacterium]|nr:protein kinase [Planctomycetia bacterium]
MDSRNTLKSPADALREIDMLCSEFDAGWRVGRPRAIEEVLSGRSDPLDVLKRLVAIEIQHRHRAGQRPTFEEYRLRFPDLSLEWLSAAFSKIDPDRTAHQTPKTSCSPRFIGRYLVRDRLGVGGMGEVYRATDPGLGRDVAIKVMLEEGTASPESRTRFEREAQALAAIKSDFVVTVYDFGFHAGQPFLVMELLRGGSLWAYLKHEGAMSSADILKLGEHLALGLAAAHERNLIHRDVKPSNVWLESDGASPGWSRAKLLDFGLIRSNEPIDEQLTRKGAVMGTPPYMAPEQLAGADRATHKSDLFSLGCVLFEAATGQRAFRGEGVMVVARQLAFSKVPPVRELAPHIPLELSELIGQLLEANPADRPASAAEVASRLCGMRMAAPEPPPRPRRPWVLLAALATVAVIGLAVGGIVSALRDRIQQEQPADQKPDTKPPVIPEPSAPNVDRERLKRDPDDTIARWVLDMRGAVIVDSAGKPPPIHDPADLPEKFSLTGLDFRGTGLTNAGLKELSAATLPKLDYIDLSDTKITNAGLNGLVKFQLKTLNLRRLSGITDDSAASISKITTLETLILEGTGFTERGLKKLQGLDKLMKLDLDKKITDETIREIRKQFDWRCNIKRPSG